MALLKHLDQYKDLIWLLVKYGQSDLVQKMGLPLNLQDDVVIETDAKGLAKDLQKLGPTYIKLGQILSTQMDLLPEVFRNELSQLQDHAEEFPYEEVKEIIKKEIHVDIKDAFLEFNHKPIAAGSLAQVHVATLHNGEFVAVKIQRPGIQEKILKDLEMFEEVAQFFDEHQILGSSHYYWKDKIDVLRKTLLNELDFKKEAQNLNIFKKNLKEFDAILVPAPINDYTTSCVLTMEYISSKKITTLHPLVKLDIDGEQLAAILFDAYLKQMFIDGFVHVDPHPGNVYLTDNNQLVFLDLGMVDHLSNHMQNNLLQLLLAITEGRGEDAVDILIRMGHAEEDFQSFKFREEIADLIAQQQHLKWEEMAIGNLLLKLARHAGEKGLRLPPKFNLFGKTLTNLNQIVRALTPSFDANSYIQNKVSELMSYRIRQLVSKENLTRSALEFSELFQKLPVKLNELSEKISNDEFKIHLFDQKKLGKAFEKIANRITLGLILAALIIGAALLMRVQTPFEIFGYPGLAILMFFGAALGGIIFIITVLIENRK